MNLFSVIQTSGRAIGPTMIPGYVQLRSVSVNSRVLTPSYERIEVDVVERR
jgi:hypothetical protein